MKATLITGERDCDCFLIFHYEDFQTHMKAGRIPLMKLALLVTQV